MEPQARNVTVPNYGLQYLAEQYYRSDWATAANSPPPQQPIQFVTKFQVILEDSRLPQVSSESSRSIAISPAQGSHNNEFSNPNAVPVLAENIRTIPQPAERVNLPNSRSLTPSGRNVASAASIGAESGEIHNKNLRLNQRKATTGWSYFPHEVTQVNYASTRHSNRQQYQSPHLLSPFHTSSPNYSDYHNPAMSLSYESRTFMPDANYPQMQMHDPQEQEEIQHDHPRYPSPPIPSSEMNPYNPQGIDATPDDAMENMPNLQHHESDAPSPGRSKPIPKPDREVTKGENGRFVCTWVGCTEEIRDFARKCEWSKHMDKHDRPYKCPADGCEKLPGFTYSGGLLRHEREVHGKHGGPRKQLNCPHLNCKRHTGKGFSRQENLNEHLRRVHTADSAIQDGADTEEEASDSKAGQKRKRGLGRGGSDDLREEMKRLRAENEELRRQSEAQTAQTAEIVAQLRQLQSAMHPRMPNAPMM